MPSVLNTQNVKEAKKRADNYEADFNCWGATLFVLNVNSILTWVDRDTMDTFLEDHTFESDDDYQKGDILAMYDDEYNGLVHTAVYIGNDKFFHKLGGGRAEITYKDGVLESYDYTNLERRRMK